VDRIDSDGVYSPNNSVLCCATRNFMKGSLSVEEFLPKAYVIVHTRPRTTHQATAHCKYKRGTQQAHAGQHQQRAQCETQTRKSHSKKQAANASRIAATVHLLTSTKNETGTTTHPHPRAWPRTCWRFVAARRVRVPCV
jgi:hypothetical protein